MEEKMKNNIEEIMAIEEVSVPESADRNKTFLIVEDERAVSDLLRQILTCNGYNVMVSSTGKESLLECDETKPDAIILDVLLPDVKGNELFDHFIHMNIPIILISVLPRGDVADIMGTRKFHFIPKPFDLKSLLGEIQSI